MSEVTPEEVEAFKIKALPEIEKLAKHYKIQEPSAVEAYGHLVSMADQVEALSFAKCQHMIKMILMKNVDKLTHAEARIGFCLGLLRVKQKPFLSDPAIHTGRNEPCPCNSGAKFKNCCLDAAKKHNMERYTTQNSIPK